MQTGKTSKKKIGRVGKRAMPTIVCVEREKQRKKSFCFMDELSKQQLNIFLFVQSRLLHFVSSGWVFFLSISIFMRVVVACTFLAGLHLALRETVSGQDFFNFCLSFTPEPAE